MTLHVAVIGAGIVGVASAIELLRDGHQVTLIEPSDPGGEQAASYGNGTLLNPSSVIPMSSPGIWKKVPGYLTDPLGPLSLRLSVDGVAAAVARGAEWTLNGAPSEDAAGLVSRLSSVPARYRREPVPAADGSIGSLSVDAGARSWSWSIGPEVEPGLWAVADSRGGASYMVPVANVREALLSAHDGLPAAGAAE